MFMTWPSFLAFAFRPLRLHGPRALVLLLTAFCSCLLVLTQSATATLSGTILDQNGAVVPGVTVTVTNKGTSAQRQATTNEDGYFTIPLLPPSTYLVNTRRDGFS